MLHILCKSYVINLTRTLRRMKISLNNHFSLLNLGLGSVCWIVKYLYRPMDDWLSEQREWVSVLRRDVDSVAWLVRRVIGRIMFVLATIFLLNSKSLLMQAFGFDLQVLSLSRSDFHLSDLNVFALVFWTVELFKSYVLSHYFLMRGWV